MRAYYEGFGVRWDRWSDFTNISTFLFSWGEEGIWKYGKVPHLPHYPTIENAGLLQSAIVSSSGFGRLAIHFETKDNNMRLQSGIMRSGLPERDFQLLLKRHDIVDADGIISWKNPHPSQARRRALENGYDDFKLCWDFLQEKMIAPGGNRNKIWGTSADLLKIVEQSLKRKVMHGALLFALELMGHHLDIVEGSTAVTIRLPKESVERLK